MEGVTGSADTRFPSDFLWGASTSSHQVEGGNHNDWTEWEGKSAKRKARSAKEKNWPEYLLGRHPNPVQEENYISGKACDHYRRFQEDFDIAKSLGHTAHRFSIEWSRIEPQEGKFDRAAIAHYQEVARALRERGMEPFVTLWHWPLPLWFAARGGWKSSSSVEYFQRYVARVVSALTDSVRFWIVLNEPDIYASHSYLFGRWPPQCKNPLTYVRVLGNLARAYRKAYDIIRQTSSSARIGIAQNMTWFESHQNRWLDRQLARIAAGWINFRFLDRIRDKQNFIGLNHYTHVRFRRGRIRNDNHTISDMGWELYPEAIYQVLASIRQRYPDQPIYITENGLADARDALRENFIRDTLGWVAKAIADGADVRGYLHWSLLDNFEWDKGFWPRFGLAEVNYKTYARKIRPSAYAYKKIIENQGT